MHNDYDMTLELEQTQPNQQPQPPPNYNYPYQQQPSTNYPYQQLPPSPSYPPPTILSSSMYTNSVGNTHIVGEVINQSPITVQFVKVTVTFYNAYNQVVGTDHGYTDPHDLAPYQRAPFDIIVLSGGIPMNQVRTYTLNVSTS